jgi:NitT/TauT family transport system permease protein
MNRLLIGLLSVVGFLAIWQAVVVIGDYPEYILPAPADVLERGREAIESGVLWFHTEPTLTVIALSLVVGISLAIGLGILLAKSHLAERVLSPYLVAAQAIPILALAPLLHVWFGPGLTARIAICVLILVFPITIATLVGIRSTDPELVEMLRSLGARPRQITQSVEIPSALPVIFGGLKVGVTLSVIGAVVAEWTGASAGLGVLINIANQGLFDTPLMFVALITLATIGLVLYGAVSLVERLVVVR